MYKYTVAAANGTPIAQYDNFSELVTFLKASYPSADTSSIKEDSVGAHEVKDGDKLLGTVMVTRRQ